MKGRFFSSPQASEVILQNDFAKELDAAPESLVAKIWCCATRSALRLRPQMQLEVCSAL